MIVAILLSYLDRIGQRRHFKDVLFGVVAAMAVVTIGGVAAFTFIDQYAGSSVQTYFETATYLIAATALTYMTFWMQRHSRTLKTDLERRSDDALSGKARAGLGVLSFQAVSREGLETMVFTLAIIFASRKQAATPDQGKLLLFGALLGLAVALCIAFAIYKLGARINLGRFFLVLGIMLMIFAAGLLADAVENLQQLGWLPFGTHVLWNSSATLSEGSNIGDLLHSLFGYADEPTVLQFIVWAAYLALASTALIRLSTRSRRSKSQKSLHQTDVAQSLPSSMQLSEGSGS